MFQEFKTVQGPTKVVIATLEENDAFRHLSFYCTLFASSVTETSLTPPGGLPIQCRDGAVVCAVEEMEKSTLFGEKGRWNVSKTLENRILHFCRLFAFATSNTQCCCLTVVAGICRLYLLLCEAR